MYHATMHAMKTVGKSGQITLGKSLVGQEFLIEELPTGDIMLKRASNIPAEELVFHTPQMTRALAEADQWFAKNPPRATDLDELENKLAPAA